MFFSDCLNTQAPLGVFNRKTGVECACECDALQATSGEMQGTAPWTPGFELWLQMECEQLLEDQGGRRGMFGAGAIKCSAPHFFIYPPHSGYLRVQQSWVTSSLLRFRPSKQDQGKGRKEEGKHDLNSSNCGCPIGLNSWTFFLP